MCELCDFGALYIRSQAVMEPLDQSQAVLTRVSAINSIS